MERIIELGLDKVRTSDSKEAMVAAVWLIDRLLELIGDSVGEDGDAKSTPFRSQLEQPRRQILGAEGKFILKATALSALDLCREQFKRSQLKRIKRDENFAEIILFLRNALAAFAGNAKSFNDNLMKTTDRFARLTKLEDIKELKNRVAAEVQELKHVVSEKQKQEQFQFAQLTERVSFLQHRLEEAKAEASVDGLTGIANRRSFDLMIQRWVAAHARNEEPFTVALFDLDNFKRINDSYGHQVGDHVLAFAALELGRNVRSSDFLARYGGEEFVILSDGMKLAEAESRFSKLLQDIASEQLQCKNIENESFNVSFTASCGVAEYALGETVNDLIRRADEALYEAKRLGKNRVQTKRRSLLGAFYEGRKRKPSVV